MKRRNFIELLSITSGAVVGGASLTTLAGAAMPEQEKKGKGGSRIKKLYADVVIAGGGLGGFAAAMSSLRNNQRVILTEETDWLGGQITSQGVPPDEHASIETHGATQMYRDFRNAIRDYYRQNYPLIEAEKNNPMLNPGGGAVSRLCHEPRAAVSVMTNMIAPYLSSGKLVLLLEHKITAADTSENNVISITATDLRGGSKKILSAPYFVDATELGDLLPLTGTEFVTGTESRLETGELHAPEKADPDNHQAFTVCFAIDYVEGENHVIEKPRDYDFWKEHVPNLNPAWPGKLLELHYSSPRTLIRRELDFNPDSSQRPGILNLWNYRKIISKEKYQEGSYVSDVTIVNWPQNDYMLGNLVGVSQKEFDKHLDSAKQLSLSLLYWLQTEAPRPDGSKGWTGLRLRKDIMGTGDGLAKYPYVRESRRIKAIFTILEEHAGKDNRAQVSGESNPKAATFFDSMGTGYYPIDLHPSSGKMNYIDFAALQFQIPLGAVIPVKMENIVPANKNIGTTHITNGCYRLHPVEWNIGEAVGLLVKFAISKNVTPREVRKQEGLLKEFQEFIRSQGVATEWPV